MQTLLDYVVESVACRNELHSKKIRKTLKKMDSDYADRANLFLKEHQSLLQKEGRTLDYAVECYLQMIADMNFESVKFQETGEYSSKSFDEVNKRVYGNPLVMEYYMHGLLLSQFLWKHHYDVLLFFNEVIKENRGAITHYLEVGGGHGLYISEAISIVGDNASYDLVDISKSSLDIAGKLIHDSRVSYFLSDIFQFTPDRKYDFITMGEVLEHVEDPVSLLKRLGDLLTASGKIFITTPTNAPTIDHIYLFRNSEDIEKVIADAGFVSEKKLSVYSEEVSQEIAERFKVSMLYATLLIKK
jgi:2-polyprenyl-3-methyl-5-hydroxy-6-metoxy-1,4-benzoquinol methylase